MTGGYAIRRVRLRELLRRKRQRPDRRAYARERAARQQVDEMKRVQQRLKDRAGTGGEGGEGTAEVAAYHGRHVDFGPLQSWPKPDPQPPVLIGGMGPRVLDRVVAYGDGWIMMPFESAYTDADLARVEELRQRAKLAGRPRPSVSAITTLLPDLEFIERLESFGVERTIFLVSSLREGTVIEPDGSTADVQRAVLARCAALVEEWRQR